nr:nucleotidyltransferase domain-containing protein [Candidatus Njordarchaeota archaeon]
MKSNKDHDLALSLMKRYAKIVQEEFREQVLAVAVFGSVARGEARFPGSDIDILVIMGDVANISLGKRIDLLAKLEKKLKKMNEYRKFEEAFNWPPTIREHILSPDELKRHPPLLLDLTTDSIILYDKGILKKELNKLRATLKKLGAKRIRTNDTWFWILKPDLKLGEELEL